MAIPNSPNWSSLTEIKPYPEPSFVKPIAALGVSAIALGPIAINESRGNLTSRYWMVKQIAEQVHVYGADGSEWGLPIQLFDEPIPIQQISLTFDQLGRPLVFYRVGQDTLKLYWYDPTAQQNVLTNFGLGKDPAACFDFPQDTGQSFTDALLFYVRDDQVFMRIQRDRYAIEYPCPAIQPDLKIKSAGLRSDNRLQVVYQFKDNGFVPPVVPVPPVQITGRYYYKMPRYAAALITEQPVIADRYNWSAGFSLRGVDSSKNNEGAILSQSASVQRASFAAHSLYPVSLFIYYLQREAGLNGTFYARVNGREFFYPANEPLQDGRYELIAGSGLLTVKRDNKIVASGQLLTARHIEDDIAPLTFCSAVSRFGDAQGRLVYKPASLSISAYIYDAWVISGGVKTEWPLDNHGSATQQSKVGNNPITIQEHRSERWLYAIS